jgi:hypothetical protein
MRAGGEQYRRAGPPSGQAARAAYAGVQVVPVEPRARPRRLTVSPQRAPPAAQARWSQSIAAVCSRFHKAAAGQAPARVCGAEKRRIRGRARSALRALTCRCMFERNDRREWSEFSDGHESEHRRAAEAKRRPPHPRAGACPAAALPRKPLRAESGRKATNSVHHPLEPKLALLHIHRNHILRPEAA